MKYIRQPEGGYVLYGRRGGKICGSCFKRLGRGFTCSVCRVQIHRLSMHYASCGVLVWEDAKRGYRYVCQLCVDPEY